MRNEFTLVLPYWDREQKRFLEKILKFSLPCSSRVFGGERERDGRFDKFDDKTFSPNLEKILESLYIFFSNISTIFILLKKAYELVTPYYLGFFTLRLLKFHSKYIGTLEVQKLISLSLKYDFCTSQHFFRSVRFLAESAERK